MLCFYGTVAILLLVGAGGQFTLSPLLAALAVMLTSMLVLLVSVMISIALFVSDLIKGIHETGYGICSGQTPDDERTGPPALTDWLTDYLNRLAGLHPESAPLTFGQLWGHSDRAGKRTINLEVMTTAVSQQMVYSIPFRDGTPTFYYDEDEWSKLFPESVMRQLTHASTEGSRESEARTLPQGYRVQSASGKALRRLPQSTDLPVIVAVRMSLSFPVLLSAVPLYAIDRSCKKTQADLKRIEAADAEERARLAPILAKRIWFSDGGIGSNMPLHMFDALLPRNPTFAVNLKPPHPSYPIKTPETPANDDGRIYLPTNNGAGHLRYWSAPSDDTALQGLWGFLAGIVTTMQNWRDEIQFPYPGFRDRILQISQKPDEGGINLDMPPERIATLSNAGCMAAQRFIDRFHPVGTEGGEGWDSHVKSRLRTFLGVLQPAAAELHGTLDSADWIRRLEGITAYTRAELDLARRLLAAVQEVGAVASEAERSLENKALKPLAQIRITPRI